MSSVDVTLPIEHITNVNPVWIREDLGDLGPLAKSIKKEGQRQPILVDSTYRVIDGARRIEAAQNIGWSTIFVVVAHDFFVASDHLVESQGTDYQLPHDIFAKIELIGILREMYRPHVRATSAKTRGQRYSKELTERATSSQVDVSRALGVSPNTVEELGRIRRMYSDPRHTPETRAQLREIMLQHRFEIYGVLDAMRGHLHVRAVTTNKKVISDQRALIPRAFAGLQGGLLALPAPELLDPGHSHEDIAAWLKQLNIIHREIFNLKKQFKIMLDEPSQGDQE